MAGGTFSGPALYTNIPLVQIPAVSTSQGPISAGLCAGVLVAPQWVLTANHCITGYYTFGSSATDYSNDPQVFTRTITVSFTDQVSGQCPASAPSCTFNSVGTIQTFTKKSIYVNGYDPEADLALFKLNAPVPTSITVPKFVAGLTAGASFKPDSNCPLDHGQTLAAAVGFGSASGNFGSNNPAANRNYHIQDGWGRTGDGDGFQREWLYTDYYTGLEPGDSGGALVSNGVLCGIASSRKPDSSYAWLSYENVYAGVDSVFAHTLLTSNVLVPGTTRIQGLCANGQDLATFAAGLSGPPMTLAPDPLRAAHVPTCAPASSSTFTGKWRFTPPTAGNSQCAPGEFIAVTGAVVKVDGAALSTPVALDASGWSLGAIPRAHVSYGITWTATDSAGLTATYPDDELDCLRVPGDFDGDHRADIVAADTTATNPAYGNDTITPVALSKGDGTFGEQDTFNWPGNFLWNTTAPIVMGYFYASPGPGANGAAGALTVDGTGAIWVGQGNGDGTFVGTTRSPSVFGPFGGESGATLLSGDFNGDGFSDFLATGVSWWQTVPVALASQFDPGSFVVLNQPNAFWAAIAGQGHPKMVVGDFDGDGLDDLAATGGSSNGSQWNTIPVAYSNGDGTFADVNVQTSTFQLYTAGATNHVVSGDFDGDGRSDIATLTGYPGLASQYAPIPIAFSTGHGSPFNVTIALSSDNTTFATVASAQNARVVVGDFDGDGRDDLAATGGLYYGGQWNTLPVAFSNGDGTFRFVNLPSSFQQYSSQAGARVYSSWK